MNGLIAYLFDLSKMELPYENMWDYYNEYTKVINLKLVNCLTKEQNSKQDNEKLQKFFQSGNEFLDTLISTSVIFEYAASGDTFSNEIDECMYYLEYRRKLTIKAGIFLPDIFIMSAFGLGKFEHECIMLAFLASLDPKYEKVFPIINNNTAKKQPTLEAAIKLFSTGVCKPYEYLEYFSPQSKLLCFFLSYRDAAATTAISLPLQLRSRITHYLTNPFSTELEHTMPLTFFEPTSEIKEMVINKSFVDRLNGIFDMSEADNSRSFHLFNLYGSAGSGRKMLFRHFCRNKEKMCIIVDCSLLPLEKEKLRQDLLYICREAILRQAYLCLENFDKLVASENGTALSISLLENVAEYLSCIFITSEEELKSSAISAETRYVPIEIPTTTEAARYTLWQNAARQKRFESSIDFHQLSTKFKFTPGQIARSMDQAACEADMKCLGKIDVNTLYESCYHQIVHNLGENATKVKAAYSWEDLVLPEVEISSLKAACNHVKFNHKVLYDWGFDKKLPYGRGLAILFSGPPGTGKTMSAQVIAGELHMEMYKIQLSKIVSKYIGETEKNLKSIFDEARKSSVILFFDETDALFGKRTEVKDSHDRYANIEVAYLLQQIEEHEGITIMATNHPENIDDAFTRRINYVIHYPFPDSEVRKTIWRKMLPASAPLSSDIDFNFLARKFEISGGSIKNIVLSSAYLAASENTSISMIHLIKSAIHELRKDKKVITRESLEEYADLY